MHGEGLSLAPNWMARGEWRSEAKKNEKACLEEEKKWENKMNDKNVITSCKRFPVTCSVSGKTTHHVKRVSKAAAPLRINTFQLRLIRTRFARWKAKIVRSIIECAHKRLERSRCLTRQKTCIKKWFHSAHPSTIRQQTHSQCSLFDMESGLGLKTVFCQEKNNNTSSMRGRKTQED